MDEADYLLLDSEYTAPVSWKQAAKNVIALSASYPAKDSYEE